MLKRYVGLYALMTWCQMCLPPDCPTIVVRVVHSCSTDTRQHVSQRRRLPTNSVGQPPSNMYAQWQCG